VNVLVTGANGMIGSAVVASAAVPAASLRTHLGTKRPDGRTRPGSSVACDITDIDALRPVADGADVVIHLAGPPSVAASFADPTEFVRAHVLGTTTVVRLCQELGIPRLVHVSSAEVYGRPRRNPVGEADPTAPRSPYAAAKLAAEGVVGAASRAWGLDAVILRPFSVYGPGARRDSVLGLILDQVLIGDRVRLRKLDGVRDYCFVDDLATAVWQAATLDLGGLHVLNIASGRGTRVDELARAALTARDGSLPRGASVEEWPIDDAVEAGTGGDRPADADIHELIGDVSWAREVLGWQATTSLVEGLARTLAWYAGDTVGRSTAAR